MGVLEDAIREHLELKRAHGASDEEVEREETEALGPARRTAPAESGAAAGEAEALVDEEFEPDDIAAEEELAPEGELPREPIYEDELEPEDEYAPAREEEFEAEDDDALAPAPEDFHSDLPPEPAVPSAPADFAGDFDEPPETEPPLAEPEPEPEPQSFGFDEEEPDEPEPRAQQGDADDVLEDTPDFLQDTPEHDRLWFEQKPPRDFDFD
jgi:hypothetical protein